MGLFDLSVEELRRYQGVNPRPADFDAYWDESLAEMNAIDPAPEIVPTDFPHPTLSCCDLRFNGTHGARVYAKLILPRHPSGEKLPAVLCFHGYSGRSEVWSTLCAYASAGFVVAALDARGQGGLSEDKGGALGTTYVGQIIRGLDDPDPKRLLFRDIFLDTAQLARVVAGLPCVDAARVAAIGGSQGGGLTLACAALADIKLAAPMYPFLSDYLRVWRMDLAKDAYAELAYYFRWFDPTHAREDAVFTKLGYIDVQHLAPRIRARVLMITGLMDTTCPPSSQFAAFNKIASPKDVVLYPDFCHERIPDANDRILRFLIENL